MLGPGLQLSVSGHLRTHVLGWDQAWPPVWWLELTLLMFFLHHLPSPAHGEPSTWPPCLWPHLLRADLGSRILSGWLVLLPLRSCREAREGSPTAEFQTELFHLSISVCPSIHPSSICSLIICSSIISTPIYHLFIFMSSAHLSCAATYQGVAGRRGTRCHLAAENTEVIYVKTQAEKGHAWSGNSLTWLLLGTVTIPCCVSSKMQLGNILPRWQGGPGELDSL